MNGTFLRFLNKETADGTKRAIGFDGICYRNKLKTFESLTFAICCSRHAVPVSFDIRNLVPSLYAQRLFTFSKSSRTTVRCRSLSSFGAHPLHLWRTSREFRAHSRMFEACSVKFEVHSATVETYPAKIRSAFPDTRSTF